MTHLKSFSFLVLLLAFSFYSYWFSNKDYEWIVPQMNDRTPAAVRESLEWKEILEKPMRVFKRESALSSIRIIERKEKQLVFSMGQFSVMAPKGLNLLCIEYPKMRLKFIAEGVAVNGKSPTAIISAPCRVNSESKDYISDIPLPFHDTERFPAQIKEIEYGDDGHKVHIRTEAIVGDWPREWVLDSVQFYKDDEKNSQGLLITQNEINAKLGGPLVVMAR